MDRMAKGLLAPLGALVLMFSVPAWSAVMTESCNGGSAGDLTPSADCTYFYDDASAALNDSAGVLNGELLHGFDSWVELQREEFDKLETSEDIGLTVTPTDGLTAGTWSFNESAWDSWNPILLVMKDGNNVPVPQQSDSHGFFAYLLDPRDNSGDWVTTNTFDGADLSHLTAYGVASVPGPAPLALIGLGLIGVGVASRRRQR